MLCKNSRQTCILKCSYIIRAFRTLKLKEKGANKLRRPFQSSGQRSKPDRRYKETLVTKIDCINAKSVKGYISWKKSRCGGWRMSNADKTCKKQKQYISPILYYTLPKYITLHYHYHYHYTILYIPYYTIKSTLLIIAMGQTPWPRGLRRRCGRWDCEFESRWGMDICLLWVLCVIR